MDALEVLRADHDLILGMLARLERGRSVRNGATQAELEAREDLVTRLVMVSSRHEAIEEEQFWPAVRAVLHDFPALAVEGIAQERDAKWTLHQIDTTKPRDPEFENLLVRFIADTRAHIGYEETEVWPPLAASADSAYLEALGARLAEARRTAPTRPHPHVSARPASLRTLGAGWAMLDRIRDRVSGRAG